MCQFFSIFFTDRWLKTDLTVVSVVTKYRTNQKRICLPQSFDWRSYSYEIKFLWMIHASLIVSHLQSSPRKHPLKASLFHWNKTLTKGGTNDVWGAETGNLNGWKKDVRTRMKGKAEGIKCEIDYNNLSLSPPHPPKDPEKQRFRQFFSFIRSRIDTFNVY